MAVRLKFQLVSKSTNLYENSENFHVQLRPVVNGSDENKEFYRWTPAGLIEFNTINRAAAEGFEFGKFYYVDISEAPA